ncbi:MAG: PilC/PilY family type IV pilus protein, partial [Thermodesulfobacteriota bacterium]
GVHNFTSSAERASNVQPLGEVVDTVAADPKNNVLDPNFINTINNMGTVDHSPLAEGLAFAGGYYNSPSSGVLPEEYCQDQFVIVVSPGMPSEDRTGSSQDLPTTLADYDNDGALADLDEGELKVDSTKFIIPTNINGSSYLDDVAHYLYTHDMVGYVAGTQNVITYTVGFMSAWESTAFLKNTSNNGNGKFNLYTTTDANYGKWHFQADSPAGLATAIIAAVNDIISRTTTFTAPVVPVTRTVSGDWVYLALFKPLPGNFWEGNLVKFQLAYDIPTNSVQVKGADGNAATAPNGALLEGAVPYWATKNWANSEYDSTESINRCGGSNEGSCNFVDNSVRKIYTFLGSTTDLTASSNSFSTGNPLLTSAILGNPTSGVPTIINYVRGADAEDEDGDSDITENREVMTGDILHSEPLIIQYDANDMSKTYIFFASNDGMLHAVKDTDGTEAWAFIPPDQLHRLRLMVEGTGHQYYVDSSPKAWIYDVDKDGVIESADGDQVIIICGERKGGTSYFALDITNPLSPVFKWRIAQSNDATTLGLPSGAAPNHTISELGETWSEPQFGVVRTSDTDTIGTHVFFIGGGFSATNIKGRGVFARSVITGGAVWQYTIAEDAMMQYSIPSTVQVVEGPTKPSISSTSYLLDKAYVGDMGGRMWRFGYFNSLLFPDANTNIATPWTGQILFNTGTTAKKFFYPPAITLEKGYDLIFMVTGNREDPCNQTTSDSVYAVKDSHGTVALTPSDLINVTSLICSTGTLPDLDGGSDKGWYLNLATGEKALAESTIYASVFYFTTFTPNDDPCLPGGIAKLYAVNYKNGCPITNWGEGGDFTRALEVGGGIPSKPVLIITEKITKIIVSVGSTNPDEISTSQEAGIPIIDPVLPPRNFYYLWWREIIK